MPAKFKKKDLTIQSCAISIPIKEKEPALKFSD